MRRGWLIIDKPEGVTSTQVVRLVKGIFRGLKVGHAGTLDPLASGILPLALGEATKTVSYVMSEQKGYTFDLVWGEKRTTDDSEGEVIETSEHRPSVDQIQNALFAFRGNILQKPPLYSALKVGGRRAYDLMRQGKEVELNERSVRIDSFEYLGETSHQDASRFKVLCGKGTYVRSLARDLADSLHTVGYARHIRRFLVGRFKEKEVLSLERLEKLDEKELIENYVLSLEAVLDDIPAFVLSSQEQIRLCQGQAIDVPKEKILIKDQETVVCVGPDDLIFALARYNQGELKPERLLKTSEKG